MHHRLDVRAPPVDFAMNEALQEELYPRVGRNEIAGQVELDHIVRRHQSRRQASRDQESIGAFGAAAAEVPERVPDALGRQDAASLADGCLGVQQSAHAAPTRWVRKSSLVTVSARSALC